MKILEWIKKNPKKSIGALAAVYGVIEAMGLGFLDEQQKEQVMQKLGLLMSFLV